ncbi:DUF3592 domain-containing protein [Streptomyces sp. UNOC14_S4]|uniref:DUF3592 domain-containing protein n=1 Tax=Streptomyces sp. UNOC14_S4 TaxID=2872340 RepID=UPI001E4E89B0|nr:DUF3592 domain-containing protein [Streptomyces sp. UNOC14_S4]MCC3770508.1 hypothetical protein [Streptomyces sp. UNOC14_S4]
MRDIFFLALPGLLAAGGIAGMVYVVVRMRRLRAAWKSGITAEGRCVGAYVVTTTHGHGHGHGGGAGHSTWHHVHEFTTPEGEVRRFEEAGGPRTVVTGDRVVVRYPEGRPDRATAIPPTEQARTLFGTGCVLAFLTLFVLGALGFMGVYLVVFRPAADKVEKKISDVVHEKPAPARSPEGFPTERPPGFPKDFPTGFPTDIPRPPADWPTAPPELPEHTGFPDLPPHH